MICRERISRFRSSNTRNLKRYSRTGNLPDLGIHDSLTKAVQHVRYVNRILKDPATPIYGVPDSEVFILSDNTILFEALKKKTTRDIWRETYFF
jgi:hypothetical protein